MRFFSADSAPVSSEYSYAPAWFLLRYTVPFGGLLGLGLGLGLGTVSADPWYYIYKETLLGLIAGVTSPFFVILTRRLIPNTPGSPHTLRHYLTYFLAGIGAGVVLLLVNALFPLRRPLFDLANLLYPLGTAGAMPLIGFIADAVWLNRADRHRTRNLFGKYVSESIAHHVLEASSSAPLEGKTYTGTVLIADIRGFTRLIQALGAEQVVHTLNDYFTRMIDVILRHQGTVNKFIGDAIVVLYNAPDPQPDANTRAIATARAMQDAVRRMNIERTAAHLPPIQIGIAIDVGEVVCGNIGSPQRLEWTAIGVPVNTSYHLAGLAPAETIYITENLYQAMDKQLAVTLAEQVELKGGTGRLNVYALGEGG